MNLRIIPIFVLAVSIINSAYAQRACAISESQTQNSVVSETGVAVPVPDVIIIPVVVHVVYNTGDQNISNDQVRSQINALNKDFRKKNEDASYIPVAFKDVAADSRIEFRLATVDPSGLTTNGIIRKQTNVRGFGTDDQIKSSVTGGADGWDRGQYLNIWVGNLSNGVVGYASLPGCAAEKDGVVISYTAFGTTGNLKAPYTKGRTAVHEIGHWLGLRHIWGDADCGDDRIEDTPPQQGPTRGCPSGVVATCSSGAAGNMYMNFMDFTNDECTSMFTAGQVTKMRELFSAEGARTALLYSNKAVGAPADELLAGDNDIIKSIALYPNPAADILNISLGGDASTNGNLNIYNQSGQLVKSMQLTKSTMQVDIRSLKGGMYYVKAGTGAGMKFMKAR